MPYFKDQNNNLYFLTQEDVDAGWLERLSVDLVEISDEEASSIRSMSSNPGGNIQIPLSVTRRQALLALLAAGLLDQVQAYMDQESTPRAVKITWETAMDFKRDNPLVLAVGDHLNLSASDLDSLFELASTL